MSRGTFEWRARHAAADGAGGSKGLAAESDLEVRFVGVDDLVSSQHRRPGRVRVQQQFGRP
ncbi:hypothetical protein [Streptomyces sp. NPDC002088]|uniref:hypothetical protein n=1 Tax=Streptomyces sp. NPDC002088 TaxID=3154665 RepID=UPI00333270BF